jgi:uncharacterized protein
MQSSKHNILTAVPGSDRWLLVNLLSGQADLLGREDAEALQRGTPRNPDELAAKGYLVDADEEARRYDKAHRDFVAGHVTDEVQLFYVPSYVCNFGCSYCFQDEYAPAQGANADVVLEAFFAYVDDVFADRKKYVTLFGGEPLLGTPAARHIVERMVIGTRTRGLDLAIVTNGYHLASYVPLLQTGRIREVQVTLDGSRAMHDKRRSLKGGGKTFDPVVAGIDACLAAGISVNLRTVVDKENLEDFAQLAHFAIDKGWTEHALFKTQIGRNYELHHCQTANSRLYTRLSLWEDLAKLIDRDPEVLRFYRPAFSVSKFLFDEGRLPDPLFDSCPATKTEWAFDSTGTIYPCTANVGKSGEAIGTFFPSRSLNQGAVDEWSGRDVTAISGCSTCSQQLACGGGCGAVSKNQAGTVRAPDCRPVKELLGLGCALYGKRELEPLSQGT